MMKEVNIPESVIGVLIFAAFCGFWCMISTLVARMGGWSALAKKYAVTIVPTGTMYRWQSLGIGRATSYNNAMNIVISSRGLCLFPMIIFRFGHHPILIPWADIRIETEQSFFGSTVSLHINNAENSVIRLSESLSKKLGIDHYAYKAPSPGVF